MPIAKHKHKHIKLQQSVAGVPFNIFQPSFIYQVATLGANFRKEQNKLKLFQMVKHLKESILVGSKSKDIKVNSIGVHNHNCKCHQNIPERVIKQQGKLKTQHNESSNFLIRKKEMILKKIQRIFVSIEMFLRLTHIFTPRTGEKSPRMSIMKALKQVLGIEINNDSNVNSQNTCLAITTEKSDYNAVELRTIRGIIKSADGYEENKKAVIILSQYPVHVLKFHLPNFIEYLYTIIKQYIGIPDFGGTVLVISASFLGCLLIAICKMVVSLIVNSDIKECLQITINRYTGNSNITMIH